MKLVAQSAACISGSSITHDIVAIKLFWLCLCDLQTLLCPFCPDHWCRRRDEHTIHGHGRRNLGTMKGGRTPPASRDYSSKGNYSGWDRRDTREASSSGYEDKRADWSNTGDRGNDHATEGDTGKNKDKDDASRTGKAKEAEKETERKKKN